MLRSWIVVVFLAVLLGAQDQKPAPPAAATATPTPALSDAYKIKLLQAQHEVDEINGQMKDLENQFKDVQAKAGQLSAQYAELQKKQPGAQAALASEKTKAFKDAGADDTKFDLDMKGLTFVPKPAPAPPAADKK